MIVDMTLGGISGKSFVIAKTSDVVFVCDDLALRQAFRSEAQKPAVWIQSLFFYLQSKELLEDNIYNDLCRKLVELNVKYTHINSNVIFDHFLLSNFCINNVSHKFFHILRGGETNNSAFIVGFDFLRMLWEQNDVDVYKKRKITFEVLLSLFINRTSKETYLKIKIFTDGMIKENNCREEIRDQLNQLQKYITIII